MVNPADVPVPISRCRSSAYPAPEWRTRSGGGARAFGAVKRAGWTEYDLTARDQAALPDYLGLPDGADVGELLDQLTDEG